MTEKNKRWNDGIVNSLNIWKDTIDGEISRVVMEMRRNVKWREVAEQEGLGSLWVGGDSLPRATAGLSSKSDSTLETHNGLLSRGLAGIEKENQQAIFDLRTFGKAGVKLGLTAFTLGEEEFGEEESERLEGTDAGLLFGFLSLKKKVKAASRPNLLGTCEILRPFLAIVKSGNTTGLIIKIALESIEHLIKLEVIDFESAEGLKALHELSMTVTQCRFEATDLVADEVVLLQILEIVGRVMTPLADEREGEVGGDGSPKQQKQDGMDGDENKGMEKKAEGTDARNKNIDVNGGGKESGFSEHGESEGNFVSSIEVSRNSDAPKNAHEEKSEEFFWKSFIES
ncbi:ARF guanine-nucleotide exchange factor GNOM [Zancudomyces culisetae]|uniref:ARF guanine-nucleotide exchange factor GNOM n=1 Tax=Zancudomyces culisetae TaxID=1213189 RepID=A0A1R1PR28_ZANCU|nr:ARF guanine-nucleotide exchange factor GNOM [Zancudomyces culisetae]|eukprot:OMH83391.1 ARF guanine-nucleotide exchange factor GNOM [Zancudomyces culisetae]